MNAYVVKKKQQGGFTLIELLVVMAIIATLAGLGMVGIPAIIRQSHKTAAQDRLSSIYDHLMIYYTDHKKWPKEPGANFPLAILTSGILDKDEKSCEIFFDPSMDFEPGPDCENCTEDGIAWTGPSFEGGGRFYTPSMRNANNHVIVANKVPVVQSDEDLDFLPHAAKGIVYLTAGGRTDWIEAGQWSEGHPVVGPESSVEKFQHLVAYDTAGQ